MAVEPKPVSGWVWLACFAGTTAIGVANHFWAAAQPSSFFSGLEIGFWVGMGVSFLALLPGAMRTRWKQAHVSRPAVVDMLAGGFVVARSVLGFFFVWGFVVAGLVLSFLPPRLLAYLFDVSVQSVRNLEGGLALGFFSGAAPPIMGLLVGPVISARSTTPKRPPPKAPLEPQDDPHVVVMPPSQDSPSN